jgi:hypothetical protein
VAREAPVEVGDFEKQVLALNLQGTKIPLAMGIVVGIEAVEGGNCVENGDLLGAAKRNHASGHHQHAPGQRAAQGIIQRANAADIHNVGHWIACAWRNTHGPASQSGSRWAGSSCSVEEGAPGPVSQPRCGFSGI